MRPYVVKWTFLRAAEGIKEDGPLINLSLVPWYEGQDRIKLQKLIRQVVARAPVKFYRWINAM